MRVARPIDRRGCTAGFRELFSVSGAGTGLVDLRLVRVSDLYPVMIDIKQSTG